MQDQHLTVSTQAADKTPQNTNDWSTELWPVFVCRENQVSFL